VPNLSLIVTIVIALLLADIARAAFWWALVAFHKFAEKHELQNWEPNWAQRPWGNVPPDWKAPKGGQQ
jgi:hypothetical protein